MKYISQVAVFIFTIWLCEKVKCNPHRRLKSLQKSFYFELQPIYPFEHFSVLLKRITPFGGYEVEHSINKRQVAQTDVVVTPIPSEVSIIEGSTLENILKVRKNGIVGKEEDIPIDPNLTPQVIITSIIKPIEDGVPVSIPLPLPGELPVDQKKIEDVETPEKLVLSESEQKVTDIVSSENVIEINPDQKIEVAQPESPDIKNIVINTPLESTVPVISKIPLIQNPNGPFLFTDISRIPLSGIYPASSVSVPEFIIPSPQLLPIPPLVVQPPLKPAPIPPPEIPPIVKEDIPIIREESPNLLVKGSRFVLYFGSMMLQMLSQLVNGRINLNQPIDIPLPITP